MQLIKTYWSKYKKSISSAIPQIPLNINHANETTIYHIDKITNLIVNSLKSATPIRHVKNTPQKLSKHITDIIKIRNSTKRIWIKVITILKPGKIANCPDSYRPISLLNSQSKVFEKLVKNLLNQHLEESNLLPDEQYGFRAQRSCLHPLQKLSNYIMTNLKNKNSVGLVTLDVQSAFDTVWHEGLLHKMMTHLFPNNLVKLMESLYW